MESLSFRPGRAFLSVNSPVVPWNVVFEDEGTAGYFYACNRAGLNQDESILDAMLIYNVATMQTPEAERIASVAWSRDGLRAVLYLDGSPQAMFDFAQHSGICRMDFPNFLEQGGDGWRKSTHAWNESAIERFEAELYA